MELCAVSITAMILNCRSRKIRGDIDRANPGRRELAVLTSRLALVGGFMLGRFSGHRHSSTVRLRFLLRTKPSYRRSHSVDGLVHISLYLVITHQAVHLISYSPANRFNYMRYVPFIIAYQIIMNFFQLPDCRLAAWLPVLCSFVATGKLDEFAPCLSNQSWIVL